MEILTNLEFVGLILTVLGAVGTVLWTVGTAMAKQLRIQIDNRFTDIKTSLKQHETEELEVFRNLHELEKDFLVFQREMPIQYVRRDDYIRGQSVIEAKLDALYNKIEFLQLKGHP